MTYANETVIWGLPVVVYETLAGIAAGIAVVGLLLSLLRADQIQARAERAWQLSWIAMSGILFSVPAVLGLHLEQPLRAVTIFFKASPTSPMPYGVLTLFLWLAIAGLGLFGLRSGALSPERRRTLSVLAALFGALFVTYLGTLLSVMKGVPLWYSPLKPVQNVVAIFGVGSAAMLLAWILGGQGREDAVAKRLTLWLMLGLIADAAVKGLAELSAMYYTRVPAMAATGLLLGQIVTEWVVGFLIPLGLLWYAERSSSPRPMLGLAAAATVVGAFAEKFHLIVGGQLISRSGGALPQEVLQHMWAAETWQALGGLSLTLFFLLVLLIAVPFRPYEEKRAVGALAGEANR